MVQLVHTAVEPADMQQSVHDVEMRVADDRDGAEQQHEIDRMRLPVQQRDVAVGKGPQGHDLVGGPDGHGAARGPEHVLVHLIAEQEPRVRHRRRHSGSA